MATISVYIITNKLNGKYYVGSSVNTEKRLWRHRKELESGTHHCIFLQRAWDKYGSDNFSFDILKQCLSLEEARALEQEYLDKEYGTLYNTSRISSGGDLISYHPERAEIVLKMKKSLEERYANLSEDERKRLYGQPQEANGMYGRKHTEEAKRKMSEANKGNQNAKGAKWSVEQRAKLSQVASERTGDKNPFYGKAHSEETKQLLSKKKKGQLPPNTKKVVIDNKVYVSATAASKDLGVAVATITNRIRSEKFPTYRFLEA